MVKVMAWRRQGDTPLSKPVVVWFTDVYMRHSTSVDAIRYMCFIFTGQKLCDGKPLGGRGRLTLPRVDAMQVFYGYVLRNNALSTMEKQQQIQAILDHYSEGATHGYCPSGATSWCKWQCDLACQTKTYRPPQDPLAAAIVQVNLQCDHCTKPWISIILGCDNELSLY